jgi:HD-GYP domain-containing protein (c-di-GMP phosphodiesterase class II)
VRLFISRVSFTFEEFDIVKRHPAQGVNILKDARQLKDIIPFIRHHHERIDGSGYPDKLSAKETAQGYSCRIKIFLFFGVKTSW